MALTIKTELEQVPVEHNMAYADYQPQGSPNWDADSPQRFDNPVAYLNAEDLDQHHQIMHQQHHASGVSQNEGHFNYHNCNDGPRYEVNHRPDLRLPVRNVPAVVNNVPLAPVEVGRSKIPKGGKRARTNFTSRQIIAFDREFRRNRFISRARRFELAQDLGLSERNIKIWFQNRRMKQKMESKKVKAAAGSPENSRGSVSPRSSSSASPPNNNIAIINNNIVVNNSAQDNPTPDHRVVVAPPPVMKGHHKQYPRVDQGQWNPPQYQLTNYANVPFLQTQALYNYHQYEMNQVKEVMAYSEATPAPVVQQQHQQPYLIPRNGYMYPISQATDDLNFYNWKGAVMGESSQDATNQASSVFNL